MKKSKPVFTFRAVQAVAITTNIPRDFFSAQNFRLLADVKSCVMDAFSPLAKAVATRREETLLTIRYGKCSSEDIPVQEERRRVAGLALFQSASLTLKPAADPEDVWHDIDFFCNTCGKGLPRLLVYSKELGIKRTAPKTPGEVYGMMLGPERGAEAFLKAHPECNFKTRSGP